MTPDAVTDSLPNKSGEGQAHSGVNRKLSRKTPRFSLMVAGRAGIGKTTLLATLFNPFLDPTTIPVEEPLIDLGKVFSQTKTISTYSFEVELSDTRLIIEACDTPGYDDGSLTPSKL